ncbi:alpha/beta fold hydrolase, partial [bacterium]|nr:alpha/beta fold hydrolase [bacterium]
MVSKAFRFLKWALVVALVGAVTLLAVRAFDAQRGPDLELWHTFVPHELSAAELDKADWKQFLAAEERAFAEVRSEVTDKLGPEARIESNRYDAASVVYPPKFTTDWNRSYVMLPEGKPVGAVVMLHGLTDSPYSLRHVARRYRDDGFVAVAARMPGHGTVPGGLSKVEWEQWTAATRLSVREALRLAGPGVPLHVIGFSNGGALAMKYALEALDDKALAQPDRIVLISPMIGITSMARFAGVMGWPAVLPAFSKAAWLGIVPEFNPFKYNSFPVNGARQSSLVANRLQQQIAAATAEGRMKDIAPILTFQSVVDFTVSTRAIVDALYLNLPANGSELVLFDVNRNTKIGALMRANTDTVL